MTLSLMLYGILIGALLAICAHAAQSLGRIAGVPLRWIWSTAILLTVALVLVAPFRGNVKAGSHSSVAAPTLSGRASPVSVRSTWSAMPRNVFALARLATVAPIERALSLVGRRLPPRLGYILLLFWISASAVLLLVIVTVHARFARARRHWPTTLLHGVRVRVATDVGPAVIGIIRPEITVPRWLIGRAAEEQQLVLSHEGEHLRARDPLLLAVAWAAVVLLPWNPAVWWILSRLRLAVELDCDARVLRCGVAPSAYGTLLIDLAEQCSPFRIGAPALADDSSHLRQRLIAMKPDTPQFPRTRALTIGTVALAALVIACETSLPTAADVARMDVTSAESAARKVSVLQGSDSNAVYSIDGTVVPSQIARALPADKVMAVQIRSSSGGAPPYVSISTHQGRAVVSGTIVAKTNGTPGQVVVTPAGNFSGLYLIDGVRADAAAVKALNPNSIASIEVVKQPFAATRYSDPLAVNGVISVTTKSKSK